MIFLGYAKISNIVLGMHKYPIFFWSTPLDQIFLGYRADAGAEPMCQEKFRVSPLGLVCAFLVLIQKGLIIIWPIYHSKNAHTDSANLSCTIRMLYRAPPKC